MQAVLIVREMESRKAPYADENVDTGSTAPVVGARVDDQPAHADVGFRAHPPGHSFRCKADAPAPRASTRPAEQDPSAPPLRVPGWIPIPLLVTLTICRGENAVEDTDEDRGFTS